MKKKIVAGNWKMNKNLHESILLADDIRLGVDQLVRSKLPTILVAPAFPFLYSVSQTLGGHPSIATAAQNCSTERCGAFTGDVSADMIRSTGARYVIIGHSERRSIFGETEALICRKVLAAYEAELSPILCIGEKLEDRTSGKYFDVVKKQLESALSSCSGEQILKTIIAYEPVWAIGTGVVASSAQAQEMHAFIRQWLTPSFSMEYAKSVPILYGGSCNPGNVRELFSCPDVDGGLIGGASLQAGDFLSIVKAAME